MSGADRSVGERLRRLRGQTGSSASTPTGAWPAEGVAAGAVPDQRTALSPPSFAERVRRLMAGPSVPRPRPPDEGELAQTLGAVSLAPGVLLLERRLDGPLHSAPRLRNSAWNAATLSALLLEMAGVPDRPAEDAPTPCFLDTETSGLAGGTGTWAFLTGLLSRDAAGWRLRQYLLTRLDAEPAYLEAISQTLAAVDLLVSYNGRAFDVPLLTTRFRLAGLTDPLQTVPHLDLLAPVRRAFGTVWPDCRLASVETRLLGVSRTGDLPGSEAPAAWLGWLRRGESAPLVGVLRHNRRDLQTLAALLPMIEETFRDPQSRGADCRAVAAYHRERGRLDQAARILDAARHGLTPAGLLDLARLYRRRSEWDQALRIWEGLTATGDAEARAELAKYHEHRTRDLVQALRLALELPDGPERSRRCERLRAKLAATAGWRPSGERLS